MINLNRGISTSIALTIIIALAVLVAGGVLFYKYYYIIAGDQVPEIDGKNKITLTKKLPLHLNFNSSCEDTSVIFTGNLWIDKVYNEENNFNRFSIKVEVNEIGDEKYNIIAFLDKIGEVHESGTGYVACSKYDIIPISGTKTFTLDCDEINVFQEVGNVSRVLLHTIPEGYKNDCNEEIELKEAINREIFRPLIICSDELSITKIGEGYIYVFKSGSFKLEIGKEFRAWEGEEAGTDYNLSKEDSKFILNIYEWAAPPACKTLLGCGKNYSFEIDPDQKTCIEE